MKIYAQLGLYSPCPLPHKINPPSIYWMTENNSAIIREIFLRGETMVDPPKIRTDGTLIAIL